MSNSLFQPYEVEYIWDRFGKRNYYTFGDYSIEQDGRVYYNHFTGDRSDANFVIYPDRADSLSSWTVKQVEQ